MLTSEIIARLWVTMTRIYGHRWTSSFGKADNGIWLAGLQKLSTGQLLRGVHACLARSDPWPPTLPEFRFLCLAIPDSEAIVSRALAGDRHELAERLRRTVDSWTRDHGTRQELLRHYRANVDELLVVVQEERAGENVDHADRLPVVIDYLLAQRER